MCVVVGLTLSGGLNSLGRPGLGKGVVVGSIFFQATTYASGQGFGQVVITISDVLNICLLSL